MATAALPLGLIDTDVLIDAERGLADAVAFLADQPSAGGIQISSVSAMELIVGCRNQQELTKVLVSLSNATICEISAAISRNARSWMRQFFLSHGLLIPDALIAATASDRHLPLYTKNVKHF